MTNSHAQGVEWAAAATPGVTFTSFEQHFDPEGERPPYAVPAMLSDAMPWREAVAALRALRAARPAGWSALLVAESAWESMAVADEVDPASRAKSPEALEGRSFFDAWDRSARAREAVAKAFARWERVTSGAPLDALDAADPDLLSAVEYAATDEEARAQLEAFDDESDLDAEPAEDDDEPVDDDVLAADDGVPAEDDITATEPAAAMHDAPTQTGMTMTLQYVATERATTVDAALDALGKAKGRARVVLLACAPHEVFAHLGYGDWNDCPAPWMHAAAIRQWGEDHGMEVVALTQDTVHAVAARPPTDLAALERFTSQVVSYAPDLAAEGVLSLAWTLLGNHGPSFWWD